MSADLTPIERIVNALAQHGCEPKPASDGYQARCPTHNDRTPSLSVNEGADGEALIHCHAGCENADIVAALELTMADLFQEDNRMNSRQEVVRTYLYRSSDGSPLYRVERLSPKGFRQARALRDGGWDCRPGCMRGVKRVPYRLPELLDAIKSGRVVHVVEGEKDADALRDLGIPATTNAGGVSKWQVAWAAQYFQGAKVAIIPDNDEPGRGHAEQVAASLHRVAAKVKVVELSGVPEKGDVSDWLMAGGTAEELRTVVREAAEWDGVRTVAPPGVRCPTDWTDIVPLEGADEPQPFPLEVLPNRLRRVVEAVSSATATPVDLSVVAALGAIAAVGSRGVSIRPTRTWGAPVPANLYVAAVLPVGEGKSPVFRYLCEPLYELEDAWRKRDLPKITEAKTLKRIALEAAERAAKEAASSDEDKRAAAERLAVALNQQAEELSIPAEPRILTVEPTPEAVIRVCGGNGGTLAVISDEGGEVFQLTQRFTSGNAANLGAFLQGFDGGHYVNDRAGRDTVRIDRLTLSLVLAIQPIVLDDVAREQANRGRGFLARFLLCLPPSEVGHRKTRLPEVPEWLVEDWRALSYGTWVNVSMPSMVRPS